MVFRCPYLYLQNIYFAAYFIYNLICRNGLFSILTGWGDGSSPLKKVILEVFPQSECNRKYTVSEFDDFKPRIDQNLPQLFQDTLLCAAVCTIKIKSLITYL